MVISTKDKLIEYISPCCSGSVHDYMLLKNNFNLSVDWFDKQHVMLDLGYIGFNKDYPNTKKISIPKKKKPKQNLAEKEKQYNKGVSSERIFVEHSIGGLKRYRILSNRLRVHLIELYDDILGICAGLWNFYLYN